MDYGLLCRSFQYHQMPYQDLVQFVADTYDDGDSLTTVSYGKEIGEPIYQYKETDWEFLKRIASTQNTVLAANATLASAKFWFGVPTHNKEVDIKSKNYTRGEMYETQEHPEYYYYEFSDKEPLMLGNKGNFILPNGKTHSLVITRVNALFESDELSFHYRAESLTYIKRHPYTNKRIKGISLSGTIINVSRNHVKVHLDIDPEQDEDKAHWYPMAYESNQVWYTMPHIGECINICIPDTE